MNTVDASWTLFEVLLRIAVALVILTLIVSYCPSDKKPNATVSLELTTARSIRLDLFVTENQPDG